MRAELVFVSDAITGCPRVRLVFCPCARLVVQSRREIHAAKVRRGSRLADFAVCPMEVHVAPPIGVGVRIQPVAMAYADGAPALAAAPNGTGGVLAGVEPGHK